METYAPPGSLLSANLQVDVRWDATTHTGSRIVSVGPSYFTPVSKAQVVGVSGSLDFVNSAYSNRSYGVSTAASAASGLRTYTAHAGLKSVAFRAFTAYDLSGDLRNGGFAVGAGVGYTILTGSASDSPIIQARGRHNSVQVAAGFGYAF
jgi:outer membrane protein